MSFFLIKSLVPCLSMLLGTKYPEIRKCKPMKKAAFVEKKRHI